VSAPIKYEDIRDGDRIRMSIEYTAASCDTGASSPDATYELIERPVVLPTVPGVYVNAADDPDVFQLLSDGQWWCGNSPVTVEQVRHDGGNSLTLLRPVAEVAAETFERAALFLENDGRSVAARQMRSYALSEANE